ncbi:ATP-binding protein [Bacillus marinisedimentorum]|uniref:ATP-binding protein n=1 Tax=Bacillus marinisedimentorum TaxID=1821260 RepID=UPI000871F4D0|nr:ATP-binding protein [Bacillus marinisedimentorum]
MDIPGEHTADSSNIEKVLYKKAFQFAKLASWVWDINTDIIHHTEDLTNILGLQHNRMWSTVNEIFDLLPEEDLSYYKESMNSIIETQEPREMNFRLLRPDDIEITVTIAIDVLKNKEGRTEKLYGITKDITSITNTELALSHTKLNLKQAFEVAGLVSWQFDIKSGELAWSENAHEIIGDSPGHIDQFAEMVHPADLRFLIAAGAKAYKGKPYNIEYRVIRKDGAVRTVYERGEVTFDRAGQPEWMCGTMQDITDRKNTEVHLANSEKLSLLGQLAAGVAHEIRNPLTSLRGFIQLMQSGIDEKEIYYDIMLAELDRIEFIVKEFLSLAKPQHSPYTKLDVTVLLDETVKLLESQANLKNIRISVSSDSSIPLIYGSDNQLKQVFINIIKNAMDATNHGGSISIRVTVPEPYNVSIEIEDEGEGIPESQLKRIGEPFYTTKEKGTGLGIMVCRRIIEAHSGSIDFKSEAGRGTTVSIILQSDLTR